MRGFNPELKPNAFGESEPVVERETQPVGTLEERLRSLSKEERIWLREDALRQYNESEKIIHVLNRIDDTESQIPMF